MINGFLRCPLPVKACATAPWGAAFPCACKGAQRALPPQARARDWPCPGRIRIRRPARQSFVRAWVRQAYYMRYGQKWSDGHTIAKLAVVVLDVKVKIIRVTYPFLISSLWYAYYKHTGWPKRLIRKWERVKKRKMKQMLPLLLLVMLWRFFRLCIR